MILWTENYIDYKPLDFEKDRVVFIGSEKTGKLLVKKSDIPQMCEECLTNDFFELIDFYYMSKKLCHPYGGGFMTWPGQLYDVFKIFTRVLADG